MVVGILVSFWDGLFSGAMLVSGSVYYTPCKINILEAKNEGGWKMMFLFKQGVIFRILKPVTFRGKMDRS